MTPPNPPISPAEPLPPVAPTSRSPSGPQRLFKALYNPTYLAILASVGLHGLAVASLPVVTPIITGGVAKPQGPIETNIVQLTPAEAARVRSAFPAPRTTAQPPAFPYFNNSNSNSNSSSSFAPPPLSGDLSKSRTRPDWASILGGNSSSADSSTSGGSSRTSSNWDTGESDATGNEYYDYSGNDYTSGGGYAYNPDDYVNIEDFVNSPPPPPEETETPDKKKVTQPQNRQAANNDENSENREVANANSTRNNSSENPEMVSANPIDLGTILGLRTGQGPIQDLEGNYPVEIVRLPNGETKWVPLDNPVVNAALTYTFDKLRPPIPQEPGTYRLTVEYSPPESDPNTNVAEDDPNPTSPTDDPEAIALAEEFQDTYPALPIVPAPAIEIPYEAALAPDAGNRARVAGIFDADGNLVDVQLLESTGDEYLDELALNSAKVGFMPVSQATLQTIDVVFDLSGSEELPTEKPTPQQTPAPAPAAPNPKPAPEPSEESAPESEPEPEWGDKVPPKTPIKPEAVEEEPTIESDPPVNPKKKPIGSQSALPSL
ncbi:MAG TPA: energy transducer TonB [Oscillatoriales cyanobacterium M59_W2019_021]|nr:energy transducer TonB [Oscillatoriales cyanobacterium M4454_W2019_049]HIK53403.1 energy transducer TonB [Oscillatoriales cyanobacterium M59_W2019_021]